MQHDYSRLTESPSEETSVFGIDSEQGVDKVSHKPIGSLWLAGSRLFCLD